MKIPKLPMSLVKKMREIKRRSMEDATDWPPPEKTVARWDHSGLRCAVVRGGVSLCGYVHVPQDHPDAKKWYDDVDVDVHGGLTFRCKAVDNGAWFGFDTGHCDDAIMIPGYSELSTNGRHWGVEDVKRETEKLAEQLASRRKP